MQNMIELEERLISIASKKIAINVNSVQTCRKVAVLNAALGFSASKGVKSTQRPMHQQSYFSAVHP